MTEKNECPTCTGVKVDYFGKYCDAHNICVTCGIKWKDLTDTPWADRRGAFQCKPCEAKERAQRIADRKEEGFDHEGTDEIVCPHCGYEHGDSWEKHEAETDCGECGEAFIVEREVSVSYSTEVKK